MTDAALDAPEPAPSSMPGSHQDSSPPPHPLHVTRLLGEAASKSSIMWIAVPGGGTHPVWFVWHDDGDPRGAGPSLYVVSGPGEQNLPSLPPEVDVIFRSKDSGGRLLTTAAATREISPDDPEWGAAAEVLRAERLNATSDVVQRWRESATIHVLSPHGRPVPPDSGSHLEQIQPGTATTASWRPWHWRGRPASRRGTN